MVLKRRNCFFLYTILACMLQGCGLLFETAMPVATPSLPEFPANLTGRYHVADSIFIDRKDTIYNAAYYEQTLPARDSLMFFSLELNIEKKIAYYTMKVSRYCKSCSSDRVYKSGNDVFPNQKEVRTYTRDGYPVYEMSHVDTIANLGRKDKLKADHKVYYLNRFVSRRNAWEIFRIKATGKEGLSLGITDGKDRKILERFVLKKGTLSAVVRLSDAQFYTFIKQGGFRYRLRFRRAN